MHHIFQGTTCTHAPVALTSNPVRGLPSTDLTVCGRWTRPPALGFPIHKHPRCSPPLASGLLLHGLTVRSCAGKAWHHARSGHTEASPRSDVCAGQASHSTAGDGERGRAAERRLAYTACLLGSSCGIILLPGWGCRRCWLRPDPANASKQGDPSAFMRSPNRRERSE